MIRPPDDALITTLLEIPELPLPAMGMDPDMALGSLISFYDTHHVPPSNYADWTALPAYAHIFPLFQAHVVTHRTETEEAHLADRLIRHEIEAIEEACRRSPLTEVKATLKDIERTAPCLRAVKIQAALQRIEGIEGNDELVGQLLSLTYNPTLQTPVEGTRKQIGNPCTEASAVFLRNLLHRSATNVMECLTHGERFHGHARGNGESTTVIQTHFEATLQPYALVHPSGSISEERIANLVDQLGALPDRSGVLITAQDKTYALARVGTQFYLFDSHGTDKLNAYIQPFTNDQDAKHFLIQLIHRNELSDSTFTREEREMVNASPDVNGFTTLFVAAPATVATYVPPLPPVSVRFDAGFGNTLTIRAAPDWERAIPMHCLPGTTDLWEATEALPAGTEYKICFNDHKWEEGATNRVAGVEDPARPLTFPS